MLPSHIENESNALIEAMLVGAPSVAAAVGGVPSVVRDGVDAVLYHDSDPFALAGAVGGVLGDPALARRMGEVARERAHATFDRAAVAHRTRESTTRSWGDAMKISIVTPSFNQKAYLESTLDSVLGQGFADLEYVVVDGGSTDGSVDTIREHEAQLAWWVSEPDNGLYHAVNKGFARTSGEIMGWINSSDTHYPWTLQTVAEIFSQLPEVEWILGVPSEFGLTGGPKKVTPAFFNIYDVAAGNYRWIQQESVFWRRRLWERAGEGLDERLPRIADLELWLRFLRLTPLYHVETLLGGFRNHDDRLGDQSDGRYEREAAELCRRSSKASMTERAGEDGSSAPSRATGGDSRSGASPRRPLALVSPSARALRLRARRWVVA